MDKYILLIISLLISLSTFAQEISGKYQRNDKIPGTEESTVINFNKNSSFEEVTKKHLGTSIIRKGDYKFKGDTLILEFQEAEQKDFEIIKSSKIIENKKSENLQTNLFIKVYFKDGKQNSDAIIHFNDANGDIFIGTTIKESNTFSLFNDKIISLKISSLGKNDIEIDLEPILGYSSTIDIYLSNVRYENTNPRRQKFIVEKLKNGSIKLTSVRKDDIWILEKV